MATIIGRASANFLKGTIFSDLIIGNTGNDTLSGDAGADNIQSGAGNDTVNGDAGDDVLYGGTGNDTINGGEGNDFLSDASGIDTFNGGIGFDTIDYSGLAAGRGVDVFLQLGYGGRDASGDKYTGIENINGSNLHDFLWGDNAVNVIKGFAGNDFMRGFGGNDTFWGGAGNDEFYGDAGSDTFHVGSGEDIVTGGTSGADIDWVDVSENTAGITLNFANNAFTGPLQEFGKPDGDQIYEVEGLRATAFNDDIDLTGAAARGMSFTIVDGGAGNDILRGAQSYFGGAGEDRIQLTIGQAEKVNLQLGLGYDKVTGFSAADGDQIVVSRAQFGGTSSTVYNWVDTTDAPQATGAGPTFILESTTQILWFDADGTGAASAPIALAGFYTAAAPPVQSDLIFVA